MSILAELGIQDSKDRWREQFLYSVAACFNRVENKFETLLSRYHLSPVKMNALLMIRHVGGERGLSQVEICKRMIVTAGNMTRLVDRLEKDRLVRRVAEEGDRRINRIQITGKGIQLLDRVWPVYQEAVDKLLSSFLKSEISNATRVLDRVRREAANPSIRDNRIEGGKFA